MNLKLSINRDEGTDHIRRATVERVIKGADEEGKANFLTAGTKYGILDILPLNEVTNPIKTTLNSPLRWRISMGRSGQHLCHYGSQVFF